MKCINAPTPIAKKKETKQVKSKIEGGKKRPRSKAKL